MRLAAALLVALAGCSPPAPSASDTATTENDTAAVSIAGPDNAIGAATLPTPELDGVATAPGRWRLDAAPAGDAALFGAAAGGPAFALRCDRAARRMLFVLAGSEHEGMLRIVTTTGAAAFPARPRRFAPGVVASTALDDPFLGEVLAPATGRIGVKLGQARTLAMPADTMVAAVIKECRAGPDGGVPVAQRTVLLDRSK
ncbi:MAG: hypothetical protein B7Y43_18790 [Sphingomonas sp. 28-62-20]|uniref:hypothetical protein n=1 Tax=Sphingomonas sp. 28-62-20 TaxID=1970433 RepID=UPI000BD17A6E|nr:MAG: hypothetical protein B7Y43_18790 [Sphingomonas sp. 28-62-20]